MLINRSKVEKELAVVLEYVNSKRKIKNTIVEKLQERGFLSGEATAIIMGANPLPQLLDEIIYMLIYVLYKNITDERKHRITPEKILTEKEIAIAKSFRISKKESSTYPVVFPNMHKDAEDDYGGIITLQQLTDLFDKRIIKYNPETQRPLVPKIYNNEEIKEIFLNKRNIKEIKEKILSGKQIPDEIIFNVAVTGEEELDFNTTKGELKIFAGDVFCISGWHRTTGGRNAYKEDPQKCSNFYYKLRIVHWEVEKAKAYVAQEALGTKLDLLSVKAYSVYNESNQVVVKLNENPKSCLRDKITTNLNDIIEGKSVVMFNVLLDIISNVFKIKDQDVASVSMYLRDAFNLICDDYPDIFASKIDERLLTAFILMMKKYYKSDDWENKLLESIDKITTNDLQFPYYTKISKNFIAQVQTYLDEMEV